VELEQDRRNVEHSVEAIAERLLQAPDPELERELAGLDTQLTSLKAQAEFNSRVQRTAETELQKRLPADIRACERLYRHWLSHVEERESARLLEMVQPGEAGKLEVRQAATVLAKASVVYGRTVSEFVEGATISYAWTRELFRRRVRRARTRNGYLRTTHCMRRRSEAKRSRCCLSATERQLSRWNALLSQAGLAVAVRNYEHGVVSWAPDRFPLTQSAEPGTRESI